MFNNIPHTKSCTSSTSSTLCGTLVYKWDDTPNDFVNTRSKMSDQLVRGGDQFLNNIFNPVILVNWILLTPSTRIFRLFKYTTPPFPHAHNSQFLHYHNNKHCEQFKAPLTLEVTSPYLRVLLKCLLIAFD